MCIYPIRRTIAVAIALMVACALPCHARSALLESDHDHEILRLEGFQPVSTWDQDGVRVFVAEQGAQVRQGPVRLSAPRMVVWFDKARSADPQVRRAIVRVYAEGRRPRPGRSGATADLVQDGQVHSAAAILMTFTSSFSFVVDCPLQRSQAPVPSGLFAKAEPLLKGDEERTWDTVPPAPDVNAFALATQGLMADRVEVFGKEMTAVYLGDVHGTFGSLVVRADAAVLWYDPEAQSYEIYAEGNVRLSRKAGYKVPQYKPGRQLDVMDLVQVASADQIYINPGRARGLATNVELRAADPAAAADLIYVFRGKEAYLIDSNTLTVRQVSLTTCNFAVPHYRFAADRAEIISQPPSTLLNAWRPRLQVGKSNKTLIALPFIGTDLTQRAYLLESYALGTSKKFGFFVQTTWRPLDLASRRPGWIESWLVNLDYYSSRGPAIGTQLEYAFGQAPGPRSRGELTAYYINDSGSEDDTGGPVPQQNRGLFHLRHRTQLNEDWRLDAEYYDISDRGFLDEYFEFNFLNEKVPESYLLARYLRNSTYVALLYKQRVNDFIRQVEELPSAELQIAGFPVGRLVYEGQVSAGQFDLEPSNLLTPPAPDPPGVRRFHTEQKLSLPFMLSALRIDPSVRVLATWASDGTAPGPVFTGSQSRTGFGAGVTIATTMSRVYDLTSELFDLNRLRHILIPFVEFETLSVSGDGSASFIQMDSIDTIDSMTEASIGLRQRLQTKRMKDGEWTPVDWLDFRIAYVSRTSDSVDMIQDQDFLRWDMDLRLTDRVSLHSWDSRIGLEDLPDVINAGIVVDFLPRCTLGLDYDFISDITSSLTAQLFYKLSDRYQLLLSQQTDFNSAGTGNDRNLETIFVIRRLLHEWVLDIGLHYEKSNDEFAVIFGFGPSGWGVFKSPRRAGRL